MKLTYLSVMTLLCGLVSAQDAPFPQGHSHPYGSPMQGDSGRPFRGGPGDPGGSGGMRGGPGMRGGRPDKSADTRLQAMVREVLPLFRQLTYKDAETGAEMEYNLFIPKDCDPSKKYPLVLFIGDATTAGRGVTEPLTQGYGGLVWASAEEQAKHPAFVLVPQYKTVTVNDGHGTSSEVEMTLRLLDSLCKEHPVDRDRLYTTGQSMGGMMSMYFNVAHHGLFAASMYVGCQWDTTTMAGFASDRFLYIVAGGDERASRGMAQLSEVLKDAPVARAEWSAKLPQAEQEAQAAQLLAQGKPINFITFTKGSVMPENGGGIEHMNSFDYAYRLETARDWLFRQTKAPAPTAEEGPSAQ